MVKQSTLAIICWLVPTKHPVLAPCPHLPPHPPYGSVSLAPALMQGQASNPELTGSWQKPQDNQSPDYKKPHYRREWSRPCIPPRRRLPSIMLPPGDAISQTRLGNLEATNPGPKCPYGIPTRHPMHRSKEHTSSRAHQPGPSVSRDKASSRYISISYLVPSVLPTFPRLSEPPRAP